MRHAHAQVTGGRNGYGAKLANIFSTRFMVETCDGSRQKRYKQVRASMCACVAVDGGVSDRQLAWK